MHLRIKVSPKSGERDQTFTTEYDGKKYTIGPEPIDVPDNAGRYLLQSFSAMLELVVEPVAPEAVKSAAPKSKTKKAKKKK